ncbi:hypothetical protein NEOLI_004341 [Neolecta irregularis DAH-3]|uniref:Uncharacterized protein n=1 Tax=Neolecta irregularis (strain DAH-3) TaxID=1198029 RepID=A0A1U7LMG2_NEOID|nr:hypothetical protein NEOLI_004341 [Neolecta irregularis DAH-3]|eukprot:OLL23845.1 hypothetical protein NEOLI_004341 [Neolecta irregularis DAH-3]
MQLFSILIATLTLAISHPHDPVFPSQFMATHAQFNPNDFPPGQIPIDPSKVIPSFTATLLNCYSFPPHREWKNAAVCEVITKADKSRYLSLLYSPDPATEKFYEFTSHNVEHESFRAHVFKDHNHANRQLEILIPNGGSDDTSSGCVKIVRDFHQEMGMKTGGYPMSKNPKRILDKLTRNKNLEQSILQANADFTETFLQFVYVQDPSLLTVVRVIVSEDIFLGVRHLYAAHLSSILYGEAPNGSQILSSEQSQDPRYRDWDFPAILRMSESSYDIFNYNPKFIDPFPQGFFPRDLLQWFSDTYSFLVNVEKPVTHFIVVDDYNGDSRTFPIKHCLSDLRDIIPVAMEYGKKFSRVPTLY